MKTKILLLLFTFLVLGIFLYFINVHNPKKDLSINYPILSAWKNLSTQYLINNVDENFLFNYYNDPILGETKTTALVTVRQVLAALYIASVQDDKNISNLSKKNIDAILEYWYKPSVNKNTNENICLLVRNGIADLGTNALFVRTLLRSQDRDKYLSQISCLVDSILSFQNKDGSLMPYVWGSEKLSSYDPKYSIKFYSGETLIALQEYKNYLLEVGREEEASKIEQKMLLAEKFYINEYITNLEENYAPPYVPWFTIYFRKRFDETNDPKYAKYIFILNDKLLEIQDQNKFVGRFYNPKQFYGLPHTSSDAVFTEGLAHALYTADKLGDLTRKEKYHKAIEISLFNIRHHTYTTTAQTLQGDNGKYFGGIRENFGESSIRIDTVAHFAEALLVLLEDGVFAENNLNNILPKYQSLWNDAGDTIIDRKILMEFSQTGISTSTSNAEIE